MILSLIIINESLLLLSKPSLILDPGLPQTFPSSTFLHGLGLSHDFFASEVSITEVIERGETENGVRGKVGIILACGFVLGVDCDLLVSYYTIFWDNNLSLDDFNLGLKQPTASMRLSDDHGPWLRGLVEVLIDLGSLHHVGRRYNSLILFLRIVREFFFISISLLVFYLVGLNLNNLGLSRNLLRNDRVNGVQRASVDVIPDLYAIGGYARTHTHDRTVVLLNQFHNILLSLLILQQLIELG